MLLFDNTNTRRQNCFLLFCNIPAQGGGTGEEIRTKNSNMSRYSNVYVEGNECLRAVDSPKPLFFYDNERFLL